MQKYAPFGLRELVVLRKYCLQHDYEIVGEYIDKKSGADANRPAFRQMFKDWYVKGFKVIIVWKLDRFSREPMFVIMGYIKQLKEKSVGLISMTESWLDTREENPVSELILVIMAWFCGEERRKISERTKLGIAKKKQEGEPWGRRKGIKDKKKRKVGGYYLKNRGVIKNQPLFIKDYTF